MKISKIEYENFRNFKDHGEIDCAIDGRVTIVYGRNGDGKTTLHQLCQWIFYGQVHFNKTATNHLYNLQYEKEQSIGAQFDVMGRIDFEHDGQKYSLTRTYTFKKEAEESAKVGEDLQLLKEDEDNNWKLLERPQEIVEKLLPSGLSEYFFFDGESMIADLKMKGTDSAKKLRTALYSMFDLDVLESALNHIGDIQYKTTILGNLYLKKGDIGSGSEVSACKTNIENAQNRIDSIKSKLKDADKEKIEKNQAIEQISEMIGSTKAKSDYEKERNEFQKHRDEDLRSSDVFASEFGDAVMDCFPKLLISKSVENAKKKIHLKVEQSNLPEGISKRLIAYLLASNTKTCICGNPLCDAEKKHIKDYLEKMPPISYANVYVNFANRAKTWGNGYEREKLETYIQRVISMTEEAQSYDKKIKDLDDEQKQCADIEKLVEDRLSAEERVKKLDESISEGETEKKKFDIYLKKEMKQFDALTAELEVNVKIEKKINIMKRVKEYFISVKNEESEKYSKKLQENIQVLLGQMLTSKRSVEVSPEFSIKVYDSYHDESKSEGQFAVVSFAYIGGIFNLMKNEESLSNKEYPLVLDGPFSKLDSDQRQNVIDAIPQFAPQVILFSKDNLQNYFAEGSIGRVWTIVSNNEKNVAHIEEGYKWN